MKNKIIEYEDMTDEQKKIIDAGNTMGGTFPSNMTRDELLNWIMENFCTDQKEDDE